MRSTRVLDEYSFASSSVPVHLARGVLGMGLLVAAFALVPVTGPLSLLLALPGFGTLRGCPGCWAMGLAATISRGRLAAACPTDPDPIVRASAGADAHKGERLRV